MKPTGLKMVIPALVAVASLAGCSNDSEAVDKSSSFTVAASASVTQAAGIHNYRFTWEEKNHLAGVGLDAQGKEVAKVEFARGEEGTRLSFENALGKGARTVALDDKRGVTFSEETQVRESGLTVRREKGVEGTTGIDISRGDQKWSYTEGDNTGLTAFMNAGWKADGLKALELRDMALVLSTDPGVQAVLDSQVPGHGQVRQQTGGACAKVATWVARGGKAAWTYVSSVRAARHACYAYMAHDMYCSLVEQGQEPDGSYVCPVTAAEHTAGLAACAAGWKGYKRKSKVAINGSTQDCPTYCSIFWHEYEEEAYIDSLNDDESIYSYEEDGTEIAFNQAYPSSGYCEEDAGTPDSGTPGDDGGYPGYY